MGRICCVGAASLVSIVLLSSFIFDECESFSITRHQLFENEGQPESNDVPINQNNDLGLKKNIFSARFENGTSLLERRSVGRIGRIKRDTCKSRPETEVMEYLDLKLPNRCWEDCDCRVGRYCTKHFYCHDISRP